MKKYSKWLLILPLLVFSGCQQENKEKETEKLSEAESAFVWQTDQEKKFGGHDYTVSSDELESELSDRFNIELPASYFEFEEAYQEGFSIEGVTKTENEYQITGSDYELMVSRETGFAKEEDLVSLGTVKATYEYMSNAKQVKLASQQLEILNWVGDDQFHGKSLEDTLKKLSEILKLDDVDQLMTDFKEKIADEEAIQGELITVYADKEDARVKKTLTVQYTDKGVVEGIYANVSDNQE